MEVMGGVCGGAGRECVFYGGVRRGFVLYGGPWSSFARILYVCLDDRFTEFRPSRAFVRSIAVDTVEFPICILYNRQYFTRFHGGRCLIMQTVLDAR